MRVKSFTAELVAGVSAFVSSQMPSAATSAMRVSPVRVVSITVFLLATVFAYVVRVDVIRR